MQITAFDLQICIWNTNHSKKSFHTHRKNKCWQRSRARGLSNITAGIQIGATDLEHHWYCLVCKFEHTHTLRPNNSTSKYVA